MAIVKSRAQGVQPTEAIQLIAKFHNLSGLADLDSFPTISIIQPDGGVIFQPTSSGVYRIAPGVYGFLYEVPYNASAGVYADSWQGLLDGLSVQAQFNFIVEYGQQPKINLDGYEALGDVIPFEYSPTAIHNINILMKGLRNRLKSSGKAQVKDEFGNIQYSDCDIFSVDQLVTFLATALSAFNMIPTFTEFTFEDSEIIKIFYAVIIQHAFLSAMAAQALIEKGREFSLTDNGVAFSPPGVSEVLGSQFSAELGNWTDMVKLIKANCKPLPRGISSYASLGSPRLRILRTLRNRQIF